MNLETIYKFKKYFSNMKSGDYTSLDEIYAESIGFVDPIHKIHGLTNLKEYFQKLDNNVAQGSFLFIDESVIENKAYLSWELSLSLKSPKKIVKAAGISVLTIEEKIIEQRDYFDAGELFYENVPILGYVIRMLKRKISE